MGLESRFVQGFLFAVTSAAVIAIVYLAASEFGVFSADQYVVRSEPNHQSAWTAFGFAGVLLLIALVKIPADSPMGLKAYLLLVLFGPTGLRVLWAVIAILAGWGGAMFMPDMHKRYH